MSRHYDPVDSLAYRMMRSTVHYYRLCLRAASDDWETGRYKGRSETYWNTLYWASIRVAWNFRRKLRN